MQYDDTPRSYFSFPSHVLIAITAMIFLLALILGIFQANSSMRLILVGNESAHIKLLHSIVVNKTFAIDPKYSDASYYNGKYYSNKPPGFPFLLAPFYHFYERFSGKSSLYNTLYFSKISNVILGSLSAVLILLFLSTFKLPTASIAFGLIAATLGTIFPAYNPLATSIPLSIFLFLTSMLFFRLSEIRRGVPAFWAVSLFASVYAIIVDYSNVFFLLPLIILLLTKMRLNKKYIAGCVISCAPIFLLLFYNYQAFENPFVLTYSYYTPPSYVVFKDPMHSMSLANVPNGLYGLLLSPARGLFLISPVTFLGIIVFWQLFKKKDWPLFLMASTAPIGIFILSAYSLWHGGHSIGYRHIIIGAIILAVLSSFLFAKCKKGIKIIAVVLLVISCLTGIMSFFIQLDQPLLLLTWKAEPADVHANYYSELLYPFIKKNLPIYRNIR